MTTRSWFARTLALLVTLCGASAAPLAAQSTPDLSALDGRWLYVEDRTEGRPVEEHQPSMSTTFGLRVEADALVHLRGQGADQREERIPRDGSVAEVPGASGSSVTRLRALETEAGFGWEAEIVRVGDGSRIAIIRRTFRPTDEGLLVRVTVGDPAQMDSLALYRHPEDIPLPTPAAATIDDLAWLAGDWVGETSRSTVEERWSPPGGGCLLGLSRTLSRGRLRAFEYLRIVERDGGLVYIAQPGGRPPTEFVLTALEGTRAVFDNPRHDSPQRITYEWTADGTLTASVGFLNGGQPQRFHFTPEDR